MLLEHAHSAHAEPVSGLHGQVTPHGVVEVAAFDTMDGLYDCAWNEENENILLAASGDGSIKVYDLGIPPQANPLRQFHEHKHEVALGADQCWLHQEAGGHMACAQT